MTLAELRESLLRRHPGLVLYISENGEYVTLGDIIAPTQGAGIGTEVMRELCAWCDEHNKVLGLSSSISHGARSKKELNTFYERFGFVSNLGSQRDFSLNEELRRDPIARPTLDAENITDKPLPQSLEQKINALAPRLIAAAQDVLDEWQPDETGYDEEFGTGGACDAISTAISDTILSRLDVDIHPGGFDGDDHAYLIVVDGQETVSVDIPAHVYETGGRYNWKKREGISLAEQDLVVSQLDGPGLEPADL